MLELVSGRCFGLLLRSFLMQRPSLRYMCWNLFCCCRTSDGNGYYSCDDKLRVPEGKFYLVDCGYANRRNFLAPFRSTRYHLQDFRGQGKDPANQNELFNHRHSSLRNVIERIFGIFKSRFLIFKCAPPFPYKTQAELVLACVVLHNYLRKECRSDIFPEETIVQQPDDEERGEEENNDEALHGTQEQQRVNANNWRANIAETMWAAALQM